MEFKINEYITVKLVRGKVQLYVVENYVWSCNYVVADIPITKSMSLLDIESFDDAADRMIAPQAPHHPKNQKIEITPEEEFWVQCSNLQVWAENNYDSRLLHRNIAFRLLKKLNDAGDPLAQKVYKQEIIKRMQSGSKNIIRYLINEYYLPALNTEEIHLIFFNDEGSFKSIFFEIFEEAADDSKLHFSERIYLLIFKHLDKEQLHSICFDEDHQYRKWLNILATSNQFSVRGLKVVKALIRKGIGEVKAIVNEKILSKKINLYSLSSGKDGFNPYFSHYTKAELTELFFDENGERRDWLNRLFNYDHDAYEKGFPILLAGYQRGIESIKPNLIHEIEYGSFTLLHYLVHSKNLSIFSQQELKTLCFDDKNQLKPWLVVRLDVYSKEMSYAFDFLKHVIISGVELAKQEIVKRIEDNHPYISSLLHVRFFDLFSKTEIQRLFFKDEKAESYKPWFQGILDEQKLSLEDQLVVIKYLIELGFHKAKDTVIYFLEHNYNRMFYLFNIKGFDKLFTGAEKAKILHFSSVKLYWDSQESKEFRINDFITLKLENKKTNIYINDKQFDKCRSPSLLFQRSKVDIEAPQAIECIEQLSKGQWSYSIDKGRVNITPEDEFWGFCSNMQVWAENNYDTTLLHFKSSFLLLKQLFEVGDLVARDVFKKEIKKRIDKKHKDAVQYILKNNFFDMFSDEEIVELLGNDFVRIKDYGIYPLEGNELDIKNGLYHNFDDIERLDKVTSLKKLSIGLSDQIYNEMMDDLDEEEDFVTSLNGLSQIPNLEELCVNIARLSKIGDSETLPKLKKLEIFFSKVVDITGIEEYKSLTYLDLRGNNISSIETLQSLRSLEQLLLGDNAISSLEPIKNLYKLEILDLHENPIKKIEYLDQLTNLTTIDCYHCTISKIDGLENQANLKSLNLTHNQITEIEGLESLTQLEKLNLKDNKITEIKGIEHLTNLKVLSLAGNEISEIKGMERLVNLETLDLRKNNITEIKGLEQLKNLKHLFLSVNPISEIKGLENLVNLEIFSLNSSELEYEVYKHFSQFADLPNIDGKLIHELKGLDTLIKLREVYLTGQNISEITGLDNLRNLESLNLMRNQITEIKGLDNLVNLQDLYLSFNQITEIKGLKNTPKLKELYLGNNEITKLKGMENLPNLTIIELDGTPLKETIQTTIGKKQYSPQNLVKYCQEQIKC
jgi:Leucine-rich repeat (LRR) protein